MMRTSSPGLWLLLALTLTCGLKASGAGALAPIPLPPPQTGGGQPLMQVLKERHTTREIKPGPLPVPTLANLLWAAFGVNRPETGHRTAPSAMNSQEVDIYVALAEGLYRYDAKAHRLNPVLSGDYRPRTSGQAFARDAAAVLIYVATLPRLEKAKPEQRTFYAAIDTGCISQNVYLYCASEGLATVVFAVDGPALSAALKLEPDQIAILSQAVGYPAVPKPKPQTLNSK